MIGQVPVAAFVFLSDIAGLLQREIIFSLEAINFTNHPVQLLEKLVTSITPHSSSASTSAPSS